MGLGSYLYRASGNIKDGIGEGWNSVTGKTASRNAARRQAQATDDASRMQKEALDRTLALNEPWRMAGINALSMLSGGLQSGAFDDPTNQGMPPSFVDNTQMPPEFIDKGFNFQADPGFEFRKREAEKAISHSAAARGGLFGGKTLSALSDRIGNMASEEVGNAYGRYSNDRNFRYGTYQDKVGQANMDRNFRYGMHRDTVGDANQGLDRRRMAMNDRFNRLAMLAGFGENATSRGGAATGMYGQQAGDNAINKGNAEAAGIVGGYNTQRDFLMSLADLGTKIYGYNKGGMK